MIQEIYYPYLVVASCEFKGLHLKVECTVIRCGNFHCLILKTTGRKMKKWNELGEKNELEHDTQAHTCSQTHTEKQTVKINLNWIEKDSWS